MLERGTPIVQVIPFRRDASDLDADIRSENETEGTVRKTILRKTLASDGWYRKFVRAQR
ncbi:MULTISPECIES: hypothetical protein [unclassified Ensifer]|uniref:hypothetical protein n=1 Tax=unclassified Ensifer TaxID=2633371 RepID=UPI00300FBA86